MEFGFFNDYDRRISSAAQYIYFSIILSGLIFFVDIIIGMSLDIMLYMIAECFLVLVNIFISAICCISLHKKRKVTPFIYLLSNILNLVHNLVQLALLYFINGGFNSGEIVLLNVLIKFIFNIATIVLISLVLKNKLTIDGKILKYVLYGFMLFTCLLESVPFNFSAFGSAQIFKLLVNIFLFVILRGVAIFHYNDEKVYLPEFHIKKSRFDGDNYIIDDEEQREFIDRYAIDVNNANLKDLMCLWEAKDLIIAKAIKTMGKEDADKILAEFENYNSLIIKLYRAVSMMPIGVKKDKKLNPAIMGGMAEGIAGTAAGLYTALSIAKSNEKKDEVFARNEAYRQEMTQQKDEVQKIVSESYKSIIMLILNNHTLKEEYLKFLFKKDLQELGIENNNKLVKKKLWKKRLLITALCIPVVIIIVNSMSHNFMFSFLLTFMIAIITNLGFLVIDHLDKRD